MAVSDTRPPASPLSPDDEREELIVELDREGIVRHTTHPDWAGDGVPRVGQPISGSLALDGAALFAVLEQARRKSRSERMVGRLLQAGALQAVTGRLTPRWDAGGHRGWILALRPEVDRTTRLLEASPGILIKAVEQMSLGVVLSDRDGRIVYANRAEAEMHGYAREELIGRMAKDLGASGSGQPPPDDRSDDLWVRVRSNRRKNGSLFPVRLISDDVRDEEGQILGRVTISEDIAARARLETMKEEFIRVVSHELRTPLTSILASLALLQGERRDSDRSDEALAIAERNSRHLLELVRDLLELQKAVSGNLELDLEPVAVGPLLAEAANRAVQASPSRSAVQQARIVVEPEASHLEPEVAVLADRERLLRVLDQLISNALKFSPPSEPVRLGVRRTEGRTTLTLRDRGPGIPDELRGRLFVPLTQKDRSTTRRGRGIGLGLSLAKALVERMDGELELARPAGADTTGTLVLIHLPNA